MSLRVDAETVRATLKALLLTSAGTTSDQIVKAVAAYRTGRRTAVLGRRLVLTICSNRAYVGGIIPILIADVRLWFAERSTDGACFEIAPDKYNINGI